MLIIIPSIVSAFFVGMVGIIGAIMTGRTAQMQQQINAMQKLVELNQADATRILSENKRLLERVDDLESELEERDGTFKQVQAWAEGLVKQVRSLGGDPIPMPDKQATKPRRAA